MELRRRISHRRDIRVSLATLYRTLKLLTAAGIIERHSFGGSRARYEGTPTTHHDHLIDLVSGKVVNFQSDEIERLIADTAAHLGYELVAYRLELHAVPLEAVSVAKLSASPNHLAPA
jgi:Fur family ferric uptake transcriptional regulator